METEDCEKYTGLRVDIECLLQQFLHTQNVRFQMFAEEWRKLNFTFIHYGIERAQERKEAMQEAYKIATEYLLPPYDLQHRVGALYILYALYVTQPYIPKFKIRISVDQWQKVVALMDTLQSQGHLDTLYVFHKLTMSKAFMFTAIPKKMIFHATYMDGKSDQNSTERWLERHRHSLMTECFDDNTLEVHHGLHEQYQKMKVNLGLHDNTSLMVVRESITEYIVKRFEKLEADFEAGREVHQTTDATDSEETEDRGSKISQIKARSYSTAAKPSRSRRHRRQTGQLPASPDPPAPKSKFTKGKHRQGSKPKDLGTDKETLTQLSSKRRALAYKEASQKVKKIKTIRAEIYLGEDATEPSPKKPRKGGKRSSNDNPEASTSTKSSCVRKAAGSSRSSGTQKKGVTKPAKKQKRSANEPRQKPSPASVSPKKKATASRKASQKQGTPRKTTTKASPPLDASEKHPQETPRKRRRTRSDTSASQKGDASEDLTPKKRLRGSGKTEAETSKEKLAKANKTVDSSDAGLQTRSHQYPSPSGDHGSPKQDLGQSSISSPRGLRSASVRGRGSASGVRGKRSSSRGHRSPPEDQRSPPREQGEMPEGGMRSPRSNVKLKMRGGGIGAKTRGARQKCP
ncbi:serine/arginine repetitive matrix protein 1-like [Patiria miniata]|uniref:snRNA-activating protein complex subunit 1 n=1 Tax=Patiria miniata TaxID=46514 RepID=A0A913Z2T2_PATMI|nr:serine/arginine repetitive matrix protein 1-like [Patiria miniata]